MPPVVGRRINLEFIKSVSDLPIADTIYRDTNNNMCIYGQCHYCTESDPACGEGNYSIFRGVSGMINRTDYIQGKPLNRTPRE